MKSEAPGPPANLAAEVRLQDVRGDDLPTLFEHQCDPEALAMAAFQARDRQAFMAHWSRILGDDRKDTKLILFRGRTAGYVASWEQHGERLIAYWLGRDHWGRGIATEALSQFLRHSQVRPLFAYVAKENLGSIRVLEKCGFKPSGASSLGDDGVEERVFVLEPTSGIEPLTC